MQVITALETEVLPSGILRVKCDRVPARPTAHPPLARAAPQPATTSGCRPAAGVGEHHGWRRHCAAGGGRCCRGRVRRSGVSRL